ncbi:MAG: acyl-CoA synthetase, partial [Actinomyces sp.]
MTAPTGARLLELAASRPDEVVCTDDEGRRRTRAELLDRATRLGRLLHARGVGPGDHIAVCTDNRVEYVETYLAAVLSGVWFVPVNPLLTPDEVAHILADSGARLVLADEPHRDLVTEATGAAVPVVTYGDELDALLAAADPTPFDPADPAGSRFSYTSGTTGRPKGVKRAIPPTVGAMLDLQARLGHQVGCDGRGTHLVTGPAHHAAPGGYAFFDLCAGARLHLMRRFDAARTLDLLESLEVTHVHLVPTMMVRLLRLPE